LKPRFRRDYENSPTSPLVNSEPFLFLQNLSFEMFPVGFESNIGLGADDSRSSKRLYQLRFYNSAQSDFI